MATFFSKDKAHRVAVIGTTYGFPGWQIDKEFTGDKYNNINADGTAQEITYDKDNGNYKEHEQVAKTAKELGKEDLIIGRTVRDRMILYTLNGQTYNVSIGWWVVSKSWLIHKSYLRSYIIELLRAVKYGNNLNPVFHSNWNPNNKKTSFIKMLEKYSGNKSDISDSYFAPVTAKNFILNVMLNSKSKVFHWWDGFMDKCEDYLSPKSRVRKKAVDDHQMIRTIIKPISQPHDHDDNSQ